MIKELRLQMKGTLQLLLLAIAVKYVHGARLPTTIPPLPPTEAIEKNTIPAPPCSSPSAATRFSFYMHDIFGGSAPSVRVVAGIVATNQGMSGIPFSKPKRGVFPKSHGVPLITANNGLNSATANNGNSNLITKGKGLPFVTAGHLPQAATTLQELLFGTVTVIDDELTEGHELGSSIIGKAQGFYLASSMDGSSHTMAFTAMFHDNNGDDHDAGEDTISFCGVHRTAAVESYIAIVGGTGKYENARGYAVIETLHHTNEHTTDGIDTLLQFSVFLTNQ